MQDRIENFFEVGSNFTDDGSFGYFYLRFTEMPVKMILVSWGQVNMGGGSRELHEVSLEPRKECHTKILPGSEKKNCQRLPNRGIARVCQNKITVSEYNNQKY